MIDMNDPEVIESLKYLLVPKEERIRLSAMPFDGKKNCFVPHKTEAFVTALIEKEDEKKGIVSVVLDDGSVSDSLMYCLRSSKWPKPIKGPC